MQPFLVAPYSSGLVRNLKPWLIPEEAFSTLQNAYTWRGRVRKRYGLRWMGIEEEGSRFRINLGTTDAQGDFSLPGPDPDLVPGFPYGIGPRFVIGDEIFTVNATGTPATLLTTGAATLATFNTTTGVLSIAGATPLSDVYFYPSLPVMGLRTQEQDDTNLEKTIGFDTKFSYFRTSGVWERLDDTTEWSGTDANFFWSTNYRGVNPYDKLLYVVNYVAADEIRYIEPGGTTWSSMTPDLDAGATRTLESALILIPFKNRLLALNTLEDIGSVETYRQRLRWSGVFTDPTATDAWRDDLPKNGGFLDAPTAQAIVSAQKFKDRLIVYFERSTWEIVYTGNEVAPFRWQQINSELGCESPFSIVGFDKAALGVGNVGIHACDGANVNRVDDKIPDEVFRIHNGNFGPTRVYGIRDYFRELVFWTFPDQDAAPTYPTRILCLNYEEGSWGIWNESLTCFGYIQETLGLTWATVGNIFPTWAQWNPPWNASASFPGFPNICAGNQQGWTFILDSDETGSEPSLQVTDMDSSTQEVTIVHHNLVSGDYISFFNTTGITFPDQSTTRVLRVIDADTITIDRDFIGTYLGGGSIRTIPQLDIWTKQYNPSVAVGQQTQIPYVDFFLDVTSTGELSVDVYTDTSDGDSSSQGSAPGVTLGDNVLRTRNEELSLPLYGQDALWHRHFIGLESQFLQLRLYLSDVQLRDSLISDADFVLNAMVIYAKPSGRIIG